MAHARRILGSCATPWLSMPAASSCWPGVARSVHCAAVAAAEVRPPLPRARSVLTSCEQPKRLRIYTRTGDKGKSSLYTGERRPKTHEVFAALGDTDELNAAIGLAREHCTDAHLALDEQLQEVQSRLLDAGSALATPLTSADEGQLQRAAFSDSHADNLEQWIDAMDDDLPTLRNFILPSGGLAAAHLHLARSVCRRAERAVVPLVSAGDAPGSVGVYLNRLSDFLFTAARFAAMKDDKPETVYKKAKA